MNIDTSLTSGEISNKINKINKIIAEITNQPSESIKTMITKGQIDNYRLLIDQSIQCGFQQILSTQDHYQMSPFKKLNKSQKKLDKSQKSINIQQNQDQYIEDYAHNIPHIIVFDECNIQLHQVLKDYKNRGIITYDSISLFNDYQFAHKKMSLQHMIHTITPQTCLICYPIIDIITGKYLLNSNLNKVLGSFKQKYSNIDLYLDMTQGLQYVHKVTETIFPFDFWSFGSNQIHSTDKTGILSFNTHLSKRWDRYQSYIQKASDKSPIMHATNELPAILNSLTVYLCNRDMKNQRILHLKKSIYNMLQQNSQIYNIKQFKFKSPTQLLQHLNEQIITQKSPIIIFDCQKPNKECIPSNIVILLIMYNNKNKLQSIKQDTLNKQLKQNQVVVDFIEPTRIFNVEQGDLSDLSIVQLTLNDLSFGFMIKQFVDSIKKIH